MNMEKVYKKETLEALVNECSSLSQILIKLGKKPYGSNFKTLKKYLDLYSINYKMIENKTWNKGKSMINSTCRNKLEDLLVENMDYCSDTLKKRLIKAGYKEYKCECCGNTEWNNKPIPLELHHINGDHYDNRLENLMVLCPNCHAQTNNHRGRKSESNKNAHRQKVKETLNKVCEYCGKEFHADKEKTRFCSVECYHSFISGVIKEQKTDNFSYEMLENLVKKYDTITDIANELKTSRTTLRKILIKNDLYEKMKNKQTKVNVNNGQGFGK